MPYSHERNVFLAADWQWGNQSCLHLFSDQNFERNSCESLQRCHTWESRLNDVHKMKRQFSPGKRFGDEVVCSRVRMKMHRHYGLLPFMRVVQSTSMPTTEKTKRSLQASTIAIRLEIQSPIPRRMKRYTTSLGSVLVYLCVCSFVSVFISIYLKFNYLAKSSYLPSLAGD